MKSDIMPNPDFSRTAIVACGTLAPELNLLRDEGFLNAGTIVFTTPGLHQDCPELERQLSQAVAKARDDFARVIVVYGGKFCYVNAQEPTRTMAKITEGLGPKVVRIQATHCMDMVASEAERDELAAGEKVWWMTPGWVKFRKAVFKGWDKALANENFPRHTGGARVLDGVGLCEQYLNEHPEEILDYSDWMGIPLQGVPVTLDRLKGLLTAALQDS
jgi:hypothetical protein